MNIPLRLYERSVDNHIDPWQQGAGIRHFEQLFHQETGIKPYIIASLPQPYGQRKQFFGMVDRIASGQGYVESVGLDFLHDSVDAQIRAAVEIPRLRIVAARAMVVASGQID